MKEPQSKRFRLVLESIRRWRYSQAPLLAAALAFYMVFSLSPLVLLSVSIASNLYGPEAATGQLVGQIRDFLGEEAAPIILLLMLSLALSPVLAAFDTRFLVQAHWPPPLRFSLARPSSPAPPSADLAHAVKEGE